MFLNYKALLILIDNHKGSIVNRSVIYGRQKCLNVENVHAEPGRTPLFIVLPQTICFN